ncbi:MAG TPA: hypothetical protein VHW24_20850 [Bryobacteraceae bacterium]|jgi:outer membrane lipoprotein-sorting protein|nr:hypothetical protein [Bryobacteraceae bacterium]
MRTCLNFVFTVAVAFAATAASQTGPEAAEILRKVAAIYKPVEQYELIVDQTVRDPGAAPVRAHVRVDFRAPNRYRMQGDIPGMASGSPESGDTIMLFDGSALWFYLPKSKEYFSISAADVASDPESSLHTPQSTDAAVLQRFRQADSFARTSHLLRSEALDIAGSKFNCYVVSVAIPRAKKSFIWWIDRRTYRVLREDSAGNTSIYSSIKLNQSLPDELFRFDPPPGSTRLQMK